MIFLNVEVLELVVEWIEKWTIKVFADARCLSIEGRIRGEGGTRDIGTVINRWINVSKQTQQ